MRDSTTFTGRSFPTQFDLSGEGVWEPLEAIARLSRDSPGLRPIHEGEFMYMGAVRDERKRVAIHLYKHIDTRRYLNVDDDGHAYAYRGPASDELDRSSGGRYQRYRALPDAIEHLQLWLFDDYPPLPQGFQFYA